MRNDRQWMYARRNANGAINKDFVEGVETFIAFALKQPRMTDMTKIRCPCTKCHNRRFQEVEEVRIHLFRKRFIPNYYEWNRHGEPYVNRDSEHSGMNVPTEAVQLGRKAFPREVYVKTHTKKGDGKTFINPKSKKVNDTIGTISDQLTPNNEEIDEVQLYYDSVGGINDKNCVYGLGSLACEYYKGASSPSTTEDGPEVQQTIRELKRRLHDQDQLIEEMHQQHELQRRKLVEDMQQQFVEQLQRQIDERIRMMIGSP